MEIINQYKIHVGRIMDTFEMMHDAIRGPFV